MSDATATEKQHFHLGDFDGPLDLLLYLIKKSEVNIYDIPIAQITEQYLAYLGYAAKADLDTMTEFYLMASTLLYIKSRMLLPVELDLDDEFDDPRKELVEKLIEYQKFRKLSDLMADREGEVEWIIERTQSQRILPFADEGIWDQVSVWDLLQTFSSLISTLSSERIIDLYEEVSVNEKITLVAELLEAKGEFLFSDLVRKRTILEVVCSFFAVLELVKERRITVYQNRLFGDIRIRGRAPEPGPASAEGQPVAAPPQAPAAAAADAPEPVHVAGPAPAVPPDAGPGADAGTTPGYTETKETGGHGTE
jgi:segregation and condensation protein A